jgi:type II secretory pathway pseudopilin PulG
MRRTSGFTVIEVVIVLMFAAVLLGVSMSAFGEVQSRMAADQAVRAFHGLHARARAQAVERGIATQLVVDVGGDSVTIRRAGQRLETIRFQSDLGVDLVGSSFVLCMGPRGFADPGCNSFSEPVKLGFSRGGDTEAVAVLPMGQLIIP